MKKVSILVPIYNVERDIERCARSLFNQTYDNLEFVFVDDYSQDRSIDILHNVIKDFPNRKDKIILIHNEKNRGLAASRNIGIENATGEFFCFVDSDDWLETNAIELLVNKQQSTEADIVYAKALMHTLEGVTELKEKDYSDKHEMMMCYSRFTPGYTMVIWRRLIRASLFLNNNIKEIEGLNYAEDKHLLSKLAYFSNVTCSLDSIIYHYNRMNEHSMVHESSQKAFPLSAHQQEIENMQAVVDFFRDNDETIYYEESSKARLRFIRTCLDKAISASSKEGFVKMVEYINNSDSSFWSEIGWNSWKRFLYRNYYYMKFFPRIKCKIKRIIG